jgi:hypothetical protein
MMPQALMRSLLVVTALFAACGSRPAPTREPEPEPEPAQQPNPEPELSVNDHARVPIRSNVYRPQMDLARSGR